MEIRSMLELEEAVNKIISQVEPLSSEIIPLSLALDRYSAGVVTSQVDLPRFDNSAMDGYAVISNDVVSATISSPVALRILGRVAAGETFAGTVKPGSCVRIFTGSPLPPGADAVVMQEDTCPDPGSSEIIHVTDTVKPWENVRFKGEDVRYGMTLIQVGDKISAPICSLLGAAGCDSLSLFRRPTVGLLATGTELVEPGQPLHDGQIFESNRIGVSGFIKHCGGVARAYPLVPDSLDATRLAIEKAFAGCDVVVTSGGVSVGEFDFVKEAFIRLGGELDFWKVAIKPGKPFVFGKLKGKFLFGLPGNPVSALVTFFLLVRPALLKLQGAARISPPRHPARLAEEVSNRGDRRHFIRIAIDENGVAQPVGIQASHILASLGKADGLLDVPAKTVLPKDSLVNIIRWA